MRTRRPKRKSICFAALSGVRVRNDALRKLGMTLPGFVERGKQISSLPSLSLLTLAAHTPPEWDVTYRDFDELDENVIGELGDHGVVAISALSARILEAYALADRLRDAGTLVVMGGLHVSALPVEALEHADAVVQGEGEPVWEGVLRDLAEGSSRGVYRAPSGFDFRLARVPRYELLDPDRYNRLTLQTTRGCPLDCSFCAASRMISRYKRKPIRQVRAELEAVLAVWERPFLELADDNTFVSKKWSIELANLLSEYPVRWFTETDISVADDDHLLEALARSGCAQLLIGLESANPQSLAGIDTASWKLARSTSVADRVRRIQSHGISVNGCFVLGFDHDDMDVFDRTFELVRQSGLTEAQITILTPFPGTRLHRELAAEGRLLEDVYWSKCTLFDVTYVPRRMTPRELEEGFSGLMARLYSSEAVKERRSHLRAHLREARR